MKYPNLLLVGRKRSGKDSIGRVLCEEWGYQRIAFATPIYQAVEVLDPYIPLDPCVDDLAIQGGRRLSWLLKDQDGDWEPLKVHPEIRRLLQYMGTEVGRNLWGEFFWVDMAKKELDLINHMKDQPVVVTDCRFVNEANALAHKAFLVRVKRPGLDEYDEHSSETEQNLIKTDFTLFNDEGLKQLPEKVRYMLAEAVRWRP
jgi:hypothetical protein